MADESDLRDTPAAARDDQRQGRRRRALRTLVLGAEAVVDEVRRLRDGGRTAHDLRIVPYMGHGSRSGAVVRARVVDDPEPPEAVEGESTWDAARRTLARFETDEVPGAPVRVSLGAASVVTRSDAEGYVDVRLDDVGEVDTTGTWARATIELAAPFRGREPGPDLRVDAPVLLSEDVADVAVISDMDDTVLRTGVQRVVEMLRTTITGSALTRTPFPGVAELYRAFASPSAGPPRAIFYVSSSPWNLHGFLTAFLRHRDIPIGPLLLRDLGVDEVLFGAGQHGAHKRDRIREVMELHPRLRFVLVGDSGELDPAIYADIVEEFPGRVLAVWIREVRLDPSDGRVERARPRFDSAGVPFLLAPDTDTAADHAVDLGFIGAADAAAVHAAVVEDREAGPLG